MLYVAIAIAGLLIGALAWSTARMARGELAANAALRELRPERIDALRLECETVFREAFGEALTLGDFERSAQLLSDRLDRPAALIAAFARPGLRWRFVLPVGAYVGELLRVHAGARWLASGEGGVEMEIRSAEGAVTAYPFETVVRQAAAGERGGLYRYLLSARHLDEKTALSVLGR